MPNLRAAVVQDGSVFADRPATLARVAARTAEAAAAGAQLVVFPEAFLGGYPKGNDLGARVGSRSAEGRALFQRYFDNAVEVPGPITAELGAIAARHQVVLVMGLVERVASTLYCSVVFFGSDGDVLGLHRKLMPTAMERLIWGFGDGSTLPVIETPLGRIGAAICWENYMPLLRTALYAQGVQLYCAPTVDERDTWLASMRHIAVEGRCFVLSACQHSLRRDYPADYRAIQGDAPDTVLIRGGSCIIDPLGQVLAGPLTDGAGVLCAELDLDLIAQGKFDLDVVGHYARPDVFQLQVNTRPQPAVIFGTRSL